MLKVLIIAGWVFFAVNAFVVGAAILSRDMGSDAAGRGLAFDLGLVGLVPLVLGGLALYFGGRANSWLGVIVSFVLLAIPILIFFGVEVEGFFHDARVRMSNSTTGRFPEQAQRDLSNAIGTANFASMRKILATRPGPNNVRREPFVSGVIVVASVHMRPTLWQVAGDLCPFRPTHGHPPRTPQGHPKLGIQPILNCRLVDDAPAQPASGTRPHTSL